MKNEKFIIHNHTKHFKDFVLFGNIAQTMSKGLLSKDGTQYCSLTTYNYEKYILLIEFTKNKNNYRIDIFEEEKQKDLEG